MNKKLEELKELANQMLSPEQGGLDCKNQFCITCPKNFPDTYIEEFFFIKIPHSKEANPPVVKLLLVVTIRGSVTQQFDTDNLTLEAKVYEKYKPHDDIPDYVLWEFTLLAKNEVCTSVNIVLYENPSIPDCVGPVFKIPAIIDEGGQLCYSIRFYQFSHFENVEFKSAKLDEMIVKQGKILQHNILIS